MMAIAMVRSQGLLKTPLLGSWNGYIRAKAPIQTSSHDPIQRHASAGSPAFCASAVRIMEK